LQRSDTDGENGAEEEDHSDGGFGS
jgi:hypothetical protein